MKNFELPEGLELVTNEKDLQQYRGGALTTQRLNDWNGEDPEDPPSASTAFPNLFSQA